MRTSFGRRSPIGNALCKRAGVPLSYRHHALMRHIICVHAMLETLATCEMEQAKRTRPSKQDQASCSKWKDAGCFLAKQQPLPCIFFAQKPPRTICLRNVSGRNNEPASADPTKHLNANRNAKQKRQRKSRARARGASHIGIPKHP